MLRINIEKISFLIFLIVELSNHIVISSSILKFPILNANYLGCFNDNQKYLNSYAFSKKTMNVKLCIDECKSRDYLYAGLLDA